MLKPAPGAMLALPVLLGMVLACSAGCGQKGALYLPEKPGTVVTRPGTDTRSNATPTPASAPAAQPAPGGEAASPPASGTGAPGANKKPSDDSQPHDD